MKVLKLSCRKYRREIYAISSIHDKLYKSSNLEEVILGDYLTELGKFVISNSPEGNVRYACSGDEVVVDAEISLPCGLLLNELLTNSLKYAVAETDHPEIKLAISTDDQNIHLLYSDNGRGMPDDFDIEASESLGMILIQQLVLQLGGTHKIYNDNGFVFESSFPMNN